MSTNLPSGTCPICKQFYRTVYKQVERTIFPDHGGSPYKVIGPDFVTTRECGCSHLPSYDPNKSELENLRDEVKELRKIIEERLPAPKITVTIGNGTGDIPYKAPDGTGDCNLLGTWSSIC
jgi:hypothetical protein